MYKSAIETQKTVKGLGTVTMDKEQRDVTLYVREAVGVTVTAEAEIKVSPEGFLDLVEPIIDAIHDRVVSAEEGK